MPTKCGVAVEVQLSKSCLLTAMLVWSVHPARRSLQFLNRLDKWHRSIADPSHAKFGKPRHAGQAFPNHYIERQRGCFAEFSNRGVASQAGHEEARSARLSKRCGPSRGF